VTEPRKSRRAKGEGQLRPRPNGRWQVSFPKREGSTERDYSTFATHAEAVRFLTAANAARNVGTSIGLDRQLLKDYAQEWLDAREADVLNNAFRASTYKRYKASLTYWVLPYLGDYQLGQLRESHVRELHKRLRAADPGRGRKALRPASIRMAHAALSVCLTDAVPRRIPHNVAKLVKRPVPAPRTHLDAPIVPPTREELGAVLAQLEGDRAELPFRLTLATGMRIGELLALKWGAVTLTGDDARVVIMASVDNDGNLGPTKSAAGQRGIRLSPRLARMLALHQLQSEADGLDTGPDGFIFQQANGKSWHGSVLRDRLKRAQVRAGQRQWRWHDIRHAVISERLKGLQPGESKLAVSRWAGHSRTAVTEDMYGHVETSTLAPMPDIDEAP
jgi:integrase